MYIKEENKNLNITLKAPPVGDDLEVIYQSRFTNKIVDRKATTRRGNMSNMQFDTYGIIRRATRQRKVKRELDNVYRKITVQ